MSVKNNQVTTRIFLLGLGNYTFLIRKLALNAFDLKNMDVYQSGRVK